MADIIVDLIKNVLNTRYERLTPEAIKYAKKSILDTIAAAMVGSTAPGCKEVVDLVKELGGKKQSTIWFYGGKAPVTSAALAIGPMARASELGDVHEGGGGHISEYIIPAVLPVTEYMGNVNGKDLITSIVLSQDLMARLGMTYTPTKRWRIYRIFGPIAAVARLFGLDNEKTINAMGIGYAQAAGDHQALPDGAQTLYIEHGFVAEAAVKSVLMAQKGITGARDVLQGQFGFYEAFEPDYDITSVLTDLGERFCGSDASLKPYPCCRRTQGAVSAVIDLIKENIIKSNDIQKIEVGVGEEAYYHTCTPPEIKYNPRNVIDRTMSLPFVVANAAVKGQVTIEDLRVEAIEPEIGKMMAKIKTHVEPSVLKPDNRLTGGAEVTITAHNKTYFKTIYHVKGHPRNPMNMDDVINKFKWCQPFAARKLNQKNMDKLIEIINNLEEIDNIANMGKLLVGQ